MEKPDKTSWNAVQQLRLHRRDSSRRKCAIRKGMVGGSGQLDSANSQEVADSEIFVMGNDAAEFVNEVKDQVRKRQKRMSNVAESGEEHSIIIWRMFMAATMNAATFMGKNFSTIQNFTKNSTDLTLKKMFDITVKLVGEQEEINNVDKIHWEELSWVSWKGSTTSESNKDWKDKIGWIVIVKSFKDYDGINGEQTEFEWYISQDSPR